VNTGIWVLVVAVVGALAFGLFRAFTDGRFRGTHRVHGLSSGEPVGPSAAEPVEGPARVSVLDGTPWAGDLGERATLLQFSSAFCAPCRAARRILGDVSSTLPGVVHLEVDAEHHLDVVRRLGIMRTPTTLVLDEHGHEVTRATGAPTKQQVMFALGAVGVDQGGSAS
jgi:thiol-disulfide isomerase/thioredoxin